MPDIADIAQEQIEAEQEAHLQAQLRRGRLPPGEPGECDLCGEWSGRLIGGVCAPCRDRHHLE